MTLHTLTQAIRTTLLTASLAAAPLAMAHSDHSHDHHDDHHHDHDDHGHSLGAHVHGEAQLQMAVEGQTIDLLFDSPAVNIVGFEHNPENEEQRQAIRDAESTLADMALVSLVNGNCEVTESHARSDFHMGDHDDHGHDHGHDDDHGHDHGHSHDHGHDDDHGHGHDHHGHNGDHGHDHDHAEFHVTQTLTCDSSISGQQLVAAVLETYDGIEKLRLEWVSEEGQGAAELTPESPRFRVR